MSIKAELLGHVLNVLKRDGVEHFIGGSYRWNTLTVRSDLDVFVLSPSVPNISMFAGMLCTQAEYAQGTSQFYIPGLLHITLLPNDLYSRLKRQHADLEEAMTRYPLPGLQSMRGTGSEKYRTLVRLLLAEEPVGQ
jgi:hypothetical protein